MPNNKQSIPPYDEPTRARAIDGEVTLSGPGNIGLSMTPKAAHASAEDLARATKKAHLQLEQRQARGDKQD